METGMKDYQLLIIVAGLFIQLGIVLPFWLNVGGYRPIPFGYSFLADGMVLLFLGLLGWVCEVVERAQREDELQRWLQSKEERWG